MQSEIDMTDDNFQVRAFGQQFCDKIWGVVADFTNIT